jgi:putative transposase
MAGGEMSKLLRYHEKSDICFITSVTHQRNRILDRHADLLLEALDRHSIQMPFGIVAYVIMPDHFHAIIDCQGHDLSDIMRKIKLSFSKKYRFHVGIDAIQVWQKRFWDHIIRNQEDMNRHIDYIHYNPIKHGLTGSPLEWKYSSIHEYFCEGYYDRDWGRRETSFVGDFGE